MRRSTKHAGSSGHRRPRPVCCSLRPPGRCGKGAGPDRSTPPPPRRTREETGMPLLVIQATKICPVLVQRQGPAPAPHPPQADTRHGQASGSGLSQGRHRVVHPALIRRQEPPLKNTFLQAQERAKWGKEWAVAAAAPLHPRKVCRAEARVRARTSGQGGTGTSCTHGRTQNTLWDPLERISCVAPQT